LTDIHFLYPCLYPCLYKANFKPKLLAFDLDVQDMKI
jgi:hypothetical protein